MIYESKFIKVEFEQSEIPWVKIFTAKPYKELSDCDKKTRKRLFKAALIAEKAMRKFYRPEKINWASFANYVPRVHVHVQARFKDDSFFPESMWGKARREGVSRDLRLDEFEGVLKSKLEKAKL